MKKLNLLKIIPLFLVVTIFACQDSGVSSRRNRERNETTTETVQTETNPPENNTPPVDGQVISSDDGKIQVVVPKNWKVENDLNDSADLQVANTSEENYLIVLSDLKSELGDFTIEKHAELTRGFIEDGITVNSISDGTKLTINSKPAIQYEIRGVVNEIDVVYLHTTIETQDYFHQLIAWTLPSEFSTNGPILQSVINSFQEN
jgi:hypothetical protein